MFPTIVVRIIRRTEEYYEKRKLDFLRNDTMCFYGKVFVTYRRLFSLNIKFFLSIDYCETVHAQSYQC